MFTTFTFYSNILGWHFGKWRYASIKYKNAKDLTVPQLAGSSSKEGNTLKEGQVQHPACFTHLAYLYNLYFKSSDLSLRC